MYIHVHTSSRSAEFVIKSFQLDLKGRHQFSNYSNYTETWHLKYYHSVQIYPILNTLVKSIVILLKYWAELIDKCVGSRIWVIMKGDKGFSKQSIHQIHVKSYILALAK